ncbi:MAG: PHP domain-containing protein [Ruminococcaceae bacterium]|nr:PHP domain-containing protein [Oscillospiraceae bacterium]
MIQDLHSHTYYSFCGADTPEQVVETAIAGGIELLGITDHQYGIGNARGDVFNTDKSLLTDDYGLTLRRYFDHINLIKEKYADKITVLRGIEICTVNQGRLPLPESADISFFDYCIIENLDLKGNTITNGDLFSFAERCACPCGIAHTNMFAFINSIGEDPLEYFKKMADKNIFWEMNVNLDTIHRGNQHKYMLDFFEDEAQQDIVRKSGVRLSIGFDGHRVYDYKPDRIKDYCRKLTAMGIKMAFEE